MVNESKARLGSPQWAKWKNSGAIKEAIGDAAKAKGQKELPGLQIGEMPIAHYMDINQATSRYYDGSQAKWIGMKAYAPDGQVRDFLWWRNFRAEGNSAEEKRIQLASVLTRLRIDFRAEVAIGQAVNLRESDELIGRVETHNQKKGYGIYVEAERRPGFSFFVEFEGVRTEEELRAEDNEKFERLFQQTLAVLPTADALGLSVSPEIQAVPTEAVSRINGAYLLDQLSALLGTQTVTERDQAWSEISQDFPAFSDKISFLRERLKIAAWTKEGYPAPMEQVYRRNFALIEDEMAQDFLTDILFSRMTASPGYLDYSLNAYHEAKAMSTEIGLENWENEQAKNITLDSMIEAVLQGKLKPARTENR